MPTQAASARLFHTSAASLHQSARQWPPFFVRLQGVGPHSWGSGTGLAAHSPVGVLRVQDFGAGEARIAGRPVIWHGSPFDLFSRFCEEFLSGRSAPETHVVVAIQYDAALPLHGIVPRRTGCLPLLLALAYRSATVTVPPPSLPDFDRAAARPSRCSSLDAAWDQAQYQSAFQRVLEYIAAGDVYQVNLAYPLRSQQRLCGWRLYETLQRINPVNFGAYFHGGDFELISNSPELFLARRGRWLHTRPIKGTRPRGRTPDEDARRITELRNDPKERAELTMIVDLERNDLGRICRVGSVEVVAHQKVETYATLHHMVSEVRGELVPGASWSDILCAMFPGGSVTGAPKRRAMQIIHELEVGSRGFYTGALGWLRAMDDADFALLIRTAVVDATGLEYWTGGGLVADSQPDREYEETRLKARAFQAAVEEAG
ncbi:MAG: hypothetical protein KatS3mg077_2602 [Candidatus Binatia bacterium]|nr:MAG: hypothetical protein KatS3mg077_2602 [Candidatus Binatia bacterium]